MIYGAGTTVMPNGTETPPIIAKRYYPTLSSVITKDDIPEVLGFLKVGLENLLGKIHYKDLQYSKSPTGDAAFYSLSIVSPDVADLQSVTSLMLKLSILQIKCPQSTKQLK